MSKLEGPAAYGAGVHDCLANVLVLEAEDEVDVSEGCVTDTASTVWAEIDRT
jgi:hypothetical protein